MTHADADDDLDDTSAPLIEHLAELRTRIMWSVLAFVVAMLLCFVVSEPILKFLLHPIEATLLKLGDPEPTLQFTSPQEYLFTLFRISMVFGLVVSFPIISYQLWRFVAPGLYKSEKKAFLPFMIASPLLFLAGAAFAQFVVVPLAMQFFLGFADFSSIFSMMTPEQIPGHVAPAAAGADPGLKITFFGKVNESLDITLKFILAFGICFQLPVLLTLMGKAGLVSARGLADMRKYAIVAILIVAGIATPPDVTSQLILFTVVYGLYEVSIFLVRQVEKKRVQELREAGVLGEDEDLYSGFDDDDDEGDQKA